VSFAPCVASIVTRRRKRRKNEANWYALVAERRGAGFAACIAGRAFDERRAGVAHLTDREREVMQLIAGGNTTKRGIAEALNISVGAASVHRSRLKHKLYLDPVADVPRGDGEELSLLDCFEIARIERLIDDLTTNV